MDVTVSMLLCFQKYTWQQETTVYMYILKLCLEIHKDQSLVYKGGKLFKNFKKLLNWIIQYVKNLETLRGSHSNPPRPTFS